MWDFHGRRRISTARFRVPHLSRQLQTVSDGDNRFRNTIAYDGINVYES